MIILKFPLHSKTHSTQSPFFQGEAFLHLGQVVRLYTYQNHFLGAISQWKVVVPPPPKIDVNLPRTYEKLYYKGGLHRFSSYQILGYRQKKPYYFYNRILKAYLCHYNVFSRLIDHLFVLLASPLKMLSSLFIIRKLTKIIP